MVRNILIATTLICYGWGATPAAFSAGAQSAESEDNADREKVLVEAALLADTSALVPGQTFRLGVRFKIERDWHIYWKYSGEAGRPTEITWTLPAGFTSEPVVYPAPVKLITEGDILSYGYEGDVLLWSRITPPKTLKPGTAVKLAAKADWLVCKKLCVIGGKTLSLALPVVADAKQARPAHTDDFDAAQRRTPVPPDMAKHVRVETGLNADRVRPGDHFAMGVHLAIENGWHIQSSKPIDEGLIATDLFLGGPDAISLSRPVFPPGQVRQRAGMKVSEYDGKVLIRVPARATADLKPGQVVIDGVLVFQLCSDDGTCLPPQSIAVAVPVTATTADAPVGRGKAEWFAAAGPIEGRPAPGEPRAVASPSGSAGETAHDAPVSRHGLAYLLLLSFAAGLILNVMPCVLPVVSIKVLSFVQQAGEEPRRVLLLGLAFVLGMLVFFAGLGVLAMAVPIGPGFVLQRPAGVIVLTAVMFGFALSLFGVFELNVPGRAAAGLQSAGSKEGPVGAFVKGFLATILGTSCTAPILSGVWVSALAAAAPVRLLVFVMMGLGMAGPYLLLAIQPGWMRFLPRPGAWMDTFKQAMGFVMLATALWLVWVLASQVGGDGVAWALVFLTVLAFGLWLVGRLPPTAGSARWAMTHIAAGAIALAGGWWTWPKMTTPVAAPSPGESAASLASAQLSFSDGIPWQAYAPGRAQELAETGRIVYVDYTARWCVTCQSNKIAVLETDDVRKAMERLRVVPLKADFTNGDPRIARDLERFQRRGVPLNLVYAPGLAEPIKLPELLTKGIVLDALRRASDAAGSEGVTGNTSASTIQP